MSGLRASKRGIAGAAALLAASLFGSGSRIAAGGEKPVSRDYSLVRAEPAPRTQDWDSADAKSAGCVSCHTASEAKTMHKSPAVVLGCVDCHGGNAAIVATDVSDHHAPAYVAARDKAHVLPKYPHSWNWPSK